MSHSTRAHSHPAIKVLLSLLLCLCLCPLAPHALAFDPNQDPVQITSAEDLNAFRASLAQQNYAGRTVVLAQNIIYTPADPGAMQPFEGNFDGQGFTISGFSDHMRGLFDSIGPGGTAQRLHLNLNAENIMAPSYGPIANTSYGTVTQCRISGLMEGGATPGNVGIGGIVGRLVDDEQNPRAQIDNCMMEASILPADGDPGQVATVTAYGAAQTTDNQRVYAVIVSGELDGDSVYGISSQGAARSGVPSYYDNTVTSVSAEDQYSVGKTFDELTGSDVFLGGGWNQAFWNLTPGMLPRLISFYPLDQPIVEEPAQENAEPATTSAPSQNISVKSVSLKDSAIALTVGQTYTLKHTISPSNATNRRVSWSTADAKIATVSNKGVVAGVSIGKTTITVTTNSGKHTASCEVTVSAAPAALALNFTEISTTVGKAHTLIPTLLNNNYNLSNIVWNNSNPAVVNMTTGANGTVNLGTLSVGTADITATLHNTTFSATCRVTVVAETVSVTGIAVNQSTLSVVSNGGTGQLYATLAPANAANQSVNWITSDPAVATVSASGLVTGVNPGTATIMAVSVDGGFTSPCVVTVTPQVAVTPTPEATPEIVVTPTSEVTPEVTPEVVITPSPTPEVVTDPNAGSGSGSEMPNEPVTQENPAP